MASEKAPKHTIVPPGAVDLDAMFAKREEEVGSPDKFPIVFRGDLFWALDPSLTSDEWQEDFEDIREALKTGDATQADVARHYMGDEEWERFVAAGGNSNVFGQALMMYQAQQTSVDALGNPTGAGRFSSRALRRSKRR